MNTKCLDKFYTNKDIALKCIQKTEQICGLKVFDLIIEPSAGNGSFYTQIKETHIIGIDIEPECENLIKQDFLKFIPDKQFKNILTIGNPPFGRVSSLAVKFFNHSSKFSNYIAFILPKTFRKLSVQNRLSLDFKLIHDEDIPDKPCSFSPKMNAKCCFQIWKREKSCRKKIILPTTHEDFKFVSSDCKNIDLALRAYGGKCGEIVTKDFYKLSPRSWHFIQTNINVQTLIANIEKINWKSSENTARQNSIGKAELVNLYNNVIDSKL